MKLPLLTNGKVGWQIPGVLPPIAGRTSDVAKRYIDGVYVVPKGWRVVTDWDPTEWAEGVCGEWRKLKTKKHLRKEGR